MKSRVKLILRPVAMSVVAALAVYGCGSGVVESVLGGGGGGVVVAGAIVNSPIDGAPLKATCADGTAGGTGVSSKGTYSMTVTCASTNFPVVISIDESKIDNANPPMMAGADLQFCTAAEKTAGTCDDVPYKTTERAPLKVAVPSTAEAANVVNMNAVTTLAAQPIEDKTAAFKADPTKAKPTATDVQTAETAIQTALGVPSVRNADPVRDAQVARVNAQVLEAVAVTKQLAGAAVKPDDVMKAVATAATTGAAGQALVKTETDGSKSFDITTAQTALTAAAAALTGTDAATVARKAAVTAVNTAMTDTKAVEGAIKSKGTSVEQVVKVVSQVPSVQAFDPLKNTLASGTIAADIKAALNDTSKADNKAAKVAAVTADLATQAIAQAVAKAQEIDADTTIASGEKSNRKKAVFEATESIRTGIEKDVTSAAATAAITADQQAKALAQVAMAVQVVADQIKTATLANIVDTTTNTTKVGVAGMAEKVSSDIAAQIATKTAADLKDVNVINASTVIGATNLTTIKNAATNVVTALADFSPPPAVGEAAVKVAVNAVISTMGATVDPTATAVKTNIQTTITTIATNLNTALGQQVTVGGVTSTMSALPADTQLKLLAQTADNMMTQAVQTAGTTTLDFATPPQPGSVTTAVTGAVTTVNTTVVASQDSPTLEPTTLTAGTGVPGFESCSAEVKVRGINVGVPIKVTATVNGQAANIGASDPFAPPPAPGQTAQPSTLLPIYISVSGGKFYPTPAGVLVGVVNNEQSFKLCVIPNAPGATYVLSAQIGSRYDFATNQFAEANKLKSISFSTVTAAAVTTTSTTAPASTTTTAPVVTSTTTAATSTTLPPCDPLAPPPTPGQPLTCEPVSSSTSASTTSTAATTTSTTTAPTTTTTVATTTTTTTAATTTTTTTAAATTTTVLGEAACKVTSGATTAYVTGAPSCASSGSGSLGLNGLTATVTSSNVPSGVTAIAYTAITQTCDPFAAPPSPGAAVSSLLCKN